MDAEGTSGGGIPQDTGPETSQGPRIEVTAGTGGGVRKMCPPVGTVCCKVPPGEKPCCTPRKGPPSEFPPGEGPTEMPELVDKDTLIRLKEAYEKTHGSMFNRSLMKKYLSRAVFDDLKYKKTKHGSTLLDVIRSGAKCQDSVVGAYAPDAESYNKFAKLYNPIIWEYHMGFSPTNQHPPYNWGNPKSLQNLEPSEGIVLYLRVSCSRNVVGFPLIRHISEAEFSQLEQKVLTAFEKLDGQFEGDYEPRAGMTNDYYQELQDNHLIFPDENLYLEAALATKLSRSRGVFLNKDRTFLVWVGVEDHLEIISLQKGGNIGEVYGRLAQGMKKLEGHLKFQKHPRLGYITMCPSNLGNTIRASAILKLPYSGYDDVQLKQRVERMNLEIRLPGDGDKLSKNCVHEISNRRRLGLTEYDSVNEMVVGVKEIIKVELAQQKSSSKTPEEMAEEQKKLQKSREEEKEKDRHRRFARRNPDGQFSEHQDPRVGSGKDKKRKDKTKDQDRDKKKDRKDRDKSRERSKDRDRERSRDRDRDRSKDRDREKPRARDKERSKDRDKERSRERDSPRSKDRDKEKPGDIDRESSKDRDKEKPGDKDREGSKDSVREKPGGKDREKSKDRDREKAGDKDREGSKDSDREKPGDKGREKSKDGDRKMPWDKDKDKSEDKDKDKSEDNDRDKSRGRDRDRSKDRTRGKSKERDRDRSRGGDRDRPRDRDKSRDRERKTGPAAEGDREKKEKEDEKGPKSENASREKSPKDNENSDKKRKIDQSKGNSKDKMGDDERPKNKDQTKDEGKKQGGDARKGAKEKEKPLSKEKASEEEKRKDEDRIKEREKLREKGRQRRRESRDKVSVSKPQFLRTSDSEERHK